MKKIIKFVYTVRMELGEGVDPLDERTAFDLRNKADAIVRDTEIEPEIIISDAD